MISGRLRLWVVLFGVLVAGAAIELIFFAHYAAPFLAVLMILLIESLRLLWLWLARRLRGRMEAGGLVIFVRYATRKSPHREWIYTLAEIVV